MKFNASIIDYIWYVGEKFHQQEHGPGDGTALIAICWYCVFFLPLISLINKLNILFMIRIFISVLLMVIPYIFCRIRYSPERKEMIRLQYKGKRSWGRRLLTIWAVLVTTAAMECIALIKIGFWHVGT